MEQIGQLEGPPRHGPTQEVLLVQDPPDVVQLLPVHRIAGEFVLIDDPQNVRNRRVHLDREHLGTRHHHFPDGCVGKFEDAPDQILFRLVENTFFTALGHEEIDLLGGDK